MAELLLQSRPIGLIKGVLFDKDGTLSHSEPQLLRLGESRIGLALQLWRQRQGGSLQSTSLLQAQLRQAFGLRDGGLDPAGTLAVAARQENLISMATVFCLHGASWSEAMGIASDTFEQLEQTAESEPMISALLPGAAELLDQLKRAGVLLAVISNDTRCGIHRFLKFHGLTDAFSAIWSADDRPRKPDPMAALSLCGSLHLEPEQCALIGDAETDLQMAHAAGLGLVIGFQGGWNRPPLLPSSTHAFNHWNELAVGTAT